MARPSEHEKWIKPDHPLVTALEGIIHDDISVDQFLAELWLHGYKISAVEEKDHERTEH
jgi:hypothetical protein